MRARVAIVVVLLPSCGGGSGRPDGGEPDTDGADPGTDGPPVGACGAIPTFEDGRSPSREVHVAPGGSDAAGDGTAQSPFATLGRAASDATPGTAIVIHAGTYPGGTYLSDLAGTAEAPIWIGGAPGEARPVLEGGAEGLHLSRVRYLVVHDLEVRGATANGINCDDGADYANPDATRYVVFRGLYIHDIGTGGNQDCLKLSGLDDFWVLDSEIARCGGGGSGSGVDHVGCHRGVVARNRLSETSGNAVQAKGGSTDIVIRQNRVVDPGHRGVNMGGSTGFEFFRPPLSTTEPNAEARNIQVVSNLFVGGETPFAFVGCAGCLAAHNTVVDPQSWLFRILQETPTDSAPYTFEPSRDGRVANNLFYFARADLSTHVNIGPDTAPDTFTFTNNLWYAHDDPSQSQPALPAPETGGLAGEDPAFADTVSWAPCDTSPAAGTGAPLPEAPFAFDGSCWPAGAPDRGAMPSAACEQALRISRPLRSGPASGKVSGTSPP